MKEIRLISPTRGEKYTISDVLKKGIHRAELSCGKWKIHLLHTCFYGSKDYALEIEDFSCSESLWSNSVNFRIDGLIPVHATKDGKLSIGFGCGCDTSYGNHFPSEGVPQNPNWDEYQKKELGSVTAWLWPGDSSENIEIIPLSEILEDEECCRILLYLVRDLFARMAFEFISDFQYAFRAGRDVMATKILIKNGGKIHGKFTLCPNAWGRKRYSGVYKISQRM